MTATNEQAARLAAAMADGTDDEIFAGAEIAPSAVAAEGPTREEIESIRANRQRLDGRVEKLKVYGSLPGYHMHIFNEDGARLDEAQRSGYAFVKRKEIQNVGRDVASFNTDPGENVRFVVGKRDNGNPMYGYLMKIPEEIFQDDQMAMEAYNAGVDGAIRRGSVGTKDEATSDTKQRYIPTSGTTYSPDKPSFVR
jgi:hypothetical protein